MQSEREKSLNYLKTGSSSYTTIKIPQNFEYENSIANPGRKQGCKISFARKLDNKLMGIRFAERTKIPDAFRLSQIKQQNH